MRNGAGMYANEAIADEFLNLAGRYREVSARLADIGTRLEAAGIRHDQVFEIALSQVPPYLDDGAARMEQAASRLAVAAKGGCSMMPCVGEKGSASERPAAFGQSPEQLSEELRGIALSLDAAMRRALDLVDRVGDAELTGDPHPFTHVIQGICLPYIVLAAEIIEKGAAEADGKAPVSGQMHYGLGEHNLR